MKILSVCGSPRKGNSEAIIWKLNELFVKKGMVNEILLLREKNIKRCDGCVEYCNKHFNCHKKDDMNEIYEKMKNADAYVFVCPNYFKMPPGIFKDFMDRASVLYTAKIDLSSKKAIVICVGEDVASATDACLDNVSKNFCETLGISIVAKRSFQANSELKGNVNDIFETKFNGNMVKELEKIVEALN